MKYMLILLIIGGLAIACTAPSTEPVIVSTSPVPTPNLEQPTVTSVPTAEPTSAVTATANVPFPITWSVTETTSADGRVIYVVDDPDVIRAAQIGYERLREYYTFPNGLPPKEQIEKDMTELGADPERIRGAVDQLEKFRESGGYWRLPPLSAYEWTDKAEFNQDGSQVSMTLTAELYRGEFIRIEDGAATFVQEGKNFSVEVVMLYDEKVGRWKMLSETSALGETGAVVTVTPAP